MAQEEFLILERKSACKRLLFNDKSGKTSLKIVFQADMPPDGPIWNSYSVSTIDLWTFIVATSSYGETVTILTMGKDGFGVNKDRFKKLDRQVQAQRNSSASLLGWTRSNMKDKYYQEFDFATLVR